MAHFGQYLFVYLCCVGGIVISVVLPILRALLPKPLGLAVLPGSRWPITGPYILTGLFAALAAVIVLAAGGDSVAAWKWHQALTAGYLWDSTLQKLVKV